jgi:multiple sugar transport system permease protein
MRQFMLGVPNELLEASRIDGANDSDLLVGGDAARDPGPRQLGIHIPGQLEQLIYPWSWLSLGITLPVALATFATGQYQADHGMLMAGSVVLVVPVLIVFILFQRWITEGIATTGLKG